MFVDAYDMLQRVRPIQGVGQALSVNIIARRVQRIGKVSDAVFLIGVIEGYTVSRLTRTTYPYENAWPWLEKEQVQEESSTQFLCLSNGPDLCSGHRQRRRLGQDHQLAM